MTAYIISVGYNSNHKKKDVWIELEKTAVKVKRSWRKIMNEVKRVEKEFYLDNIKDIESYAKLYPKCVDLTFKIYNEIGKPQYIYQAASGGGFQREIKETLRRAVCRLIVNDMHKKKMEVDISVC